MIRVSNWWLKFWYHSFPIVHIFLSGSSVHLPRLNAICHINGMCFVKIISRRDRSEPTGYRKVRWSWAKIVSITPQQTSPSPDPPDYLYWIDWLKRTSESPREHSWTRSFLCGLIISPIPWDEYNPWYLASSCRFFLETDKLLYPDNKAFHLSLFGIGRAWPKTVATSFL